MTAHHILIVDDHPGIRESFADLFEFEGFTVTTAINGFDALSKLAQGILPCWILLDLTMPLMDGLECLVQIKRHAKWKDIPVTLLSAAGQLADKAAQHHVDYLEKPTETDVLIALARKHASSVLLKSRP